MSVSCGECVIGLQQLQTSTNGSNTEPKLQFRGRTTQPLFAILECHAVDHIDETRGYVEYAAGPYEECDERLSDMTAAII